MLHRKFLLLLVLWLGSPLSHGCECLWQGSFKEVVGEADLVVWGMVNQRQGNSFDIMVRELLRGEDYRDTLRIWGKKDALCRPETEAFAPGSQWILALKRIDNPPADSFDPFRPNISFGRKGDFYLSSCGVYWLEVNSERVSGNILDGARWQYMDEKKTPVLMSVFKSWLAGTLDDTRLAEASKPQAKTRELMNDTQIYLWEQNRQDD